MDELDNRSLDTDLSLDENSLDDLDVDSDNDIHTEEPQDKKEQQPNQTFNVGEQCIKICSGGVEIETHFTTLTPEQSCDLTIWLLQNSQLTAATKKDNPMFQ